MKPLAAVPCFLMAFLTACSSLAPTPAPIPTIMLDAASPGETPAAVIQAEAVIVPIREARLSFPSVGRVVSVEVNVGDKVEAGQTLVRLDTTVLEARVREAEANLAAAEIQVKYLKRVGTDERHLESAEAEVKRAQALLDLAKAALASQSALTAPFEGTVVSVDTAPGEIVVPGRVVVTLGDFSKFQVKTTDLSERDVTRIRIGRKARISIAALGETFTGQVTDIALVSSNLGSDVVFTVTIDFDRQPQGLLWGMSADVEIETE